MPRGGQKLCQGGGKIPQGGKIFAQDKIIPTPRPILILRPCVHPFSSANFAIINILAEKNYRYTSQLKIIKSDFV